METPNTPSSEPRAAVVIGPIILHGGVMTLVVGVIMLLLGLWIGYTNRPTASATLQASQVFQAYPAPAGNIGPTSAVETPVVSVATTAPLPASTQTPLAASLNTSPTPDERATIFANVVARARHFKGDPNAPVTIIEFGDFQCPFCGRFATNTEPQLDAQYIEAGNVRFAYLHFAFLGEESFWAAEASECAADQEAFWEYHDQIFNNQSGENQGAFSQDNLKRFAGDLGLDMEAFNACFDSGKYTDLVREDSAFAQSLGVRSTPSFLINGEPLIGAQPIEAFQEMIQRILTSTETE